MEPAFKAKAIVVVENALLPVRRPRGATRLPSQRVAPRSRALGINTYEIRRVVALPLAQGNAYRVEAGQRLVEKATQGLPSDRPHASLWPTTWRHPFSRIEFQQLRSSVRSALAAASSSNEGDIITSAHSLIASRRARLSLALVVSSAITACGGGGADGVEPASAQPQAMARAQAVEATVFAQSPVSGWSTWSVMQRDPTDVKVKAQAKALHDSGLVSHGYIYANIDDFWYLNPGTDVDSYGRWVADPARFPKGMKDMGDYIHGQGEKFGMYLTPGIAKAAYDQNTPIEGTSFHARDIVSDTSKAEKNYRHLGNIMYFIDYNKNPAAAQAFLNSWANQLASWGVDYVKIDGVGSGDKDDVIHWSQALRQSGRQIFFGLSNNLGTADISTWQTYANAWRISGDVDCCQPEHQTTWALVSSRFSQAPKWAKYAGPGHWNDFDSMQIGDGDKVGINADERKSGMTLWAVSAASLLVGADLTTLDKGDLALMTNDEVLAVNRAGLPATPVSQSSDQQVWKTKNKDGTYTVALFNLGGSTATVTAHYSDLGFGGTATIRDLWERKDVGSATDFFSRSLPSHGSALFTVTPSKLVPLGGPVISTESGRCMDDPSSSLTDATQLQVWDCNGGDNQRITYSASDKSLKVLGKCFDAYRSGTANGTHVQIYTCSGEQNQQWDVNADGTITGAQSGLCLDVNGSTNPNGSVLQLWACNGGTNQKWTLSAGVKVD